MYLKCKRLKLNILLIKKHIHNQNQTYLLLSRCSSSVLFSRMQTKQKHNNEKPSKIQVKVGFKVVRSKQSIYFGMSSIQNWFKHIYLQILSQTPEKFGRNRTYSHISSKSKNAHVELSTPPTFETNNKINRYNSKRIYGFLLLKSKYEYEHVAFEIDVQIFILRKTKTRIISKPFSLKKTKYVMNVASNCNHITHTRILSQPKCILVLQIVMRTIGKFRLKFNSFKSCWIFDCNIFSI